MPERPEEAPVNLSQGPPIADWLQALSHDSSFESQQAAALWGRAAPPPAAVRDLISQLHDHDPEARIRAISSLGEIGSQAHRALSALGAALKEAALKDENETVRAAATRAVLEVGPRPVSEVSALIDALQDELDVVRFHAAIALGDFGREAHPALGALIHASLWDEDPAVRVEAAVALWKVDHNKAPLVVPTLIKALGDTNELICWIAADCLGQMGPEARDSVPALQQAMQRTFKMSLLSRAMALALLRIEGHAPATVES
jgi:HEAT repeat protein